MKLLGRIGDASFTVMMAGFGAVCIMFGGEMVKQAWRNFWPDID